MNVLLNDDILYNVISFLNLNEKLTFVLINKEHKNICTKLINYHIGEIIGNYLGIDYKIKQDALIIKQISFLIIKEIIKCLESNKIYITTKYIELGLINRIYNSNVNLCKFKLLTPNIFRINKIKRSYEVNSKYLKTKFKNVYAIII
tara:strand:- start:1364 stop:1804 length:441 start_codon:yes stop_codon:yes gene_type:complete